MDAVSACVWNKNADLGGAVGLRHWVQCEEGGVAGARRLAAAQGEVCAAVAAPAAAHTTPAACREPHGCERGHMVVFWERAH